MTDKEIIEYVVKDKEDPHEDEIVDLAAVENEEEGIEFIGILEEAPERERERENKFTRRTDPPFVVVWRLFL